MNTWECLIYYWLTKATKEQIKILIIAYSQNRLSRVKLCDFHMDTVTASHSSPEGTRVSLLRPIPALRTTHGRDALTKQTAANQSWDQRPAWITPFCPIHPVRRETRQPDTHAAYLQPRTAVNAEDLVSVSAPMTSDPRIRDGQTSRDLHARTLNSRSLLLILLRLMMQRKDKDWATDDGKRHTYA